ncbi:hypothetical protein EX30DRAFT_174139 [Ascodesmis nigricans]|uniref:Uncharacterized protein n=1 Tax=Ascodesmis nigricans TaxID=341454 RepID=A0A4S2MLM8_9PEZI|nr:hypothetical protein EX30DRAFT_174139 [Ascodesmis nigricans]
MISAPTSIPTPALPPTHNPELPRHGDPALLACRQTHSPGCPNPKPGFIHCKYRSTWASLRTPHHNTMTAPLPPPRPHHHHHHQHSQFYSLDFSFLSNPPVNNINDLFHLFALLIPVRYPISNVIIQRHSLLLAVV